MSLLNWLGVTPKLPIPQAVQNVMPDVSVPAMEGITLEEEKEIIPLELPYNGVYYSKFNKIIELTDNEEGFGFIVIFIPKVDGEDVALVYWTVKPINDFYVFRMIYHLYATEGRGSVGLKIIKNIEKENKLTQEICNVKVNSYEVELTSLKDNVKKYYKVKCVRKDLSISMDLENTRNGGIVKWIQNENLVIM